MSDYTGPVVLIVVLSALTALALWLEHVEDKYGDIWQPYRTDPRDLVDRAHRYGEEVK